MTEDCPEQIRDVMLDCVADGVFTVDKQRRITCFNRAAEVISGVARAEAIGEAMRIIGGQAAGRLLKVPKGLAVRPTPDLVRQAIFNSLGDAVAEARVLELLQQQQTCLAPCQEVQEYFLQS